MIFLLKKSYITVRLVTQKEFHMAREITPDEIKHIVSYENRFLEHKEFNIKENTFPNSVDIVKTIQGMINSTGKEGFIIIGIRDIANLSKDNNDLENWITPIVYPARIRHDNKKTINISSFDEYRRHLSDKLRTSTHKFCDDLIEIEELEHLGRKIVRIKVKRSPDAPHGFKTSGEDKTAFFIRKDGCTRPMTFDEIDEAYSRKYTQKNNKPERVWTDPSKPILTTTKEGDHYFIEGAYAFLRIIPDNTSKVFSCADLEQLSKKNVNIHAFARDRSNPGYQANEKGYVIYEVDHPKNLAIIDCLTQIYKDGSIEGMYSLNSVECIPSVYLGSLYTMRLKEYLTFCEERLNLDLPLKWEAGLMGVKNYPFRDKGKGWDRPIAIAVQDEIKHHDSIKNYNTDPKEILEPFFKEILDKCGLGNVQNTSIFYKQ